MEEIYDAYTKGRITNEHYTHLKSELSNLYAYSLRKAIDSVFSKFKNDKEKIDDLKENISTAYIKGILNETNYELLKDKISNYENQSK
jgi:hypothetical protein